MIQLEKGQTYYLVTFADRDFTMPGVRPLVYVGKNIVGDETEDQYYFQDTVSYVQHGIAFESVDSLECEVSSFGECELGESIVEQQTLPAIVSRAAEKWKKLGGTMLKPAHR